MADVSSTLNNLAKLTLIACDDAYFTDTNPAPNVLAPLPDPDPTIPRYDFSAAAGFTVAIDPVTQAAIKASNSATGGKYIVYLNQATNQAIVAFGGTDGLDPKDWSQNTNLGWDQWVAEKSQVLQALSNLVGANPDLQINFTGQSLGGALAQYAIYDWVKQEQQFAQVNDTTYDKSKVTLTTFNGLGGLFALEKYDSYDPSVLTNIGPSGNFYVANDLVSQLGGVTTAPNGATSGPYVGVHVGGPEYLLNFSKTDPVTGKLTQLDFVDAHRIETAFYPNLTPLFGFTAAQPVPIAPLNIFSQEKIAAFMGNVLNQFTLNPVNASANFVGALLTALSLGTPQDVTALMQAVLTSQRNAGTLSGDAYDKLYSWDWGTITAPLRPATLAGGVALSTVSLIGSFLTEVVMQAGTSLVDAFNSISSYLNTSNVSVTGTINGSIPAPQEVSAIERELQMALAFPGAMPPSAGAADLVALETAAGVTTDPSQQAAFDTYVGELLGVPTNGQDWLVNAMDYLRGQAQANEQGTVQKDTAALRLGSDILALAESIPDAEAGFLATTKQDVTTFLLDTAKGIGNAAPLKPTTPATSTFDLAQPLSFAEYQQVERAFEQALNDSSIDVTIKPAIEQATAILEAAGEDLVLEVGTAVNPFATPGFDPATAPPATVSLTQDSAQTLTLSLPYAAGTGGQKIQLQLQGSEAGDFTFYTNAGAFSGGDVIDLTVPQGDQQMTFALVAGDSVRANSTLTLSATLLDQNGAPQGTSQLEATITLTDVPPSNDWVTQTLVPFPPDPTGPPSVQTLLDSAIGGLPYQMVNVLVPANTPNTITFAVTGDGNDTLYGHGANETLLGGAGNDSLYAGAGNQLLLGDIADQGGVLRHPSTGNVTLEGQDYVVGGPGQDTLSGGGGSDILMAGTGNTFMFGDVIPVSDPMTAYFNGFSDLDLTIADTTVPTGDAPIFNPTASMALSAYQSIIWPGITFPVWGGGPTNVNFSGNDVLIGGSGNDTMAGDGGNDTLYGGSGNDIMFGDYLPGPYMTLNPNGNDLLIAGTGNDVMYGEGGDDTLIGGTGNDTLSGGGGNNLLEGGSGNMTYEESVISTPTFIFGVPVYTPIQDTILDATGSNKINTIQFAPGITLADLSFVQDPVKHTLLITYDTAGDSIQLDNFDPNNIDGSWVINTLSFAADYFTPNGSQVPLSSVVTLNGYYEVGPGDQTVKMGAGDDTVIGGSGNDTIHGGGGNNVLVGGAGNDVFYAEGLQDTIEGGLGNNTVIGTGGGTYTYVYEGGNSQDVIEPQQGGSYIIQFTDGLGSSVGVNRSGNDLALRQSGAAGSLILQSYYVGTTYQLELPAQTQVTQTATPGNTVLTAYAGPTNVLVGDNSGDLFYGGAATDTIQGGTGNDTLVGASGGNYTYAYRSGGGQDVLDASQGGAFTVQLTGSLSPSNTTVTRSRADLTLNFVGGQDSLTLKSFYADPIFKVQFPDGTVWDKNELHIQAGTSQSGLDPAGNNVLTAYRGFPTELVAPGGNNTFYVNNPTDTVVQGPLGTNTIYSTVDYTLPANVQNLGLSDNTIFGSQGETLYPKSQPTMATGNELNNTLWANSFNDVLNGGLGDDRLFAGILNRFESPSTSVDDTLIGGPGNDTYFFSATYGGIDTIIDDTSTGDTNTLIINGDPSQMYLALEGSTLKLVSPYQDGSAGENTHELLIPSFDPTDAYRATAINQISFDSGETFITYQQLIQQLMGMGIFIQDGSPNQLVTGTNVDDRITGKPGDTLAGGAGNDTYLFNPGDGAEVIQDVAAPGALNAIAFGAGITPFDLSFLQGSNTLTIQDGMAGDQLTLALFDPTGVDGSLVVGTLEFADGLQLNLSDLLSNTPNAVNNAVIQGTDNADLILVTGTNDTVVAGAGDDTVLGGPGQTQLSGGGGIDYLVAGSGNASLVGGAGNDTLEGAPGNDTLVGGPAEDVLIGGSGETTYVFNIGDGHDAIEASPESTGPIQLVFGPGISLADLSFGVASPFDNSIQTIMIGTNGDEIDLPTDEGIDQMTTATFADGTTVSLQQYLQQILDGNVPQYSPPNGFLVGGSGTDYLGQGELGNEPVGVLIGGAGNDIYFYNRGDGTETIQDIDRPGEGNQILFGPGISQSQITFTQGNNALTITDGTAGDALTLNNFDPTHTNGSLVVETLAFADGSTVSLASLLGLGGPVATNGDDTITTGAGNDVVDALGGNDIVDTGAGNDTITGGTGNDQLIGGTGDDTYIFNAGDGVDTITDTAAPGEGNMVEFGTGISSTDLTLGLGSLLIRVGTNGDAIHLTPFDPNDALGPHAIETFRFADGTTLSYSQLVARGFDLTGTAGTDAITGTNVVDRISGLAGNDTVQSGAGDDVLDGGAGADTLVGGQGNDTYVVDNVGDVVTEQLNEGADTVQSVISYTLGVNVENLTLMGTSALDGTGNELANVLTGNEAANVLAGGDGTDTLTGNGGNDILNGGLGADILNGGDGDDLLYVDAADTSVNGGAGFDVVNVVGPSGVTLDVAAANIEVAIGSDGNETFNGAGAITALSLDGGEGTDVLAGGSGNDVLAGGEGNDILTGNEGNDVLNGGAGADVLNGGAGDDLFYVDAADTSISGGEGHNALSVLPGSAGVTLDVAAASIEDAMGGDGNDTFDGTTATATLLLQGNGGNDTLLGGAGTDALNGGSGNDQLNGGVGADILVGGTGDDTYVVDDPGDQVTENLNEGTDTVQSRISVGLGANVENLTLLGTAAIDGTGNSANNVFMGNIAANVLDGGLGADTMVGGTGNDTYLVDDAGDVVTELANEGTDAVQSAITYTLGTNVENLTLTGTTAITGTGNGLDNVLTGNSAANILTGGAGNDTYVVSTGDTVVEAVNQGLDTVVSDVTWTLGANLENLTLTGGAAINGTGNTLNNVLIGNSANNSLNGGTGADQMAGGAGHDTYVVDNAGDVVTELANEGTDLVQSSLSYSLGANVENVTLTGTAAIAATGNSLNNVLTGNSGANVLAGGAGDDTYVVGAGDTVIEQLNEGTDTVQSSVTYTLAANVENLTLTGSALLNGTGNALANVLTGNSAANVLDGGAGDDQLTGGAGADTLLGGSGNDLYVVDNVGDVVTEQLNEGLDTVQSSVSYTLSANVEQLTVTGTGAINATGNSLNNVLTGNSGANVLDGGTGADTLVGGAGNDTYVVDNAGDVVTENANEGTDTVQASVNYTLRANLENLTLTGTAAITGTGNADNNVLTGNSGNNVLDGGGGTDTLRGGLGDDTYVIDDATDVVTENLNEGTDTVQTALTTTLGANIENLTLMGSAVVNGTGNTLNNVLTGNSAANILNGGTGADSLIGGQGDDTYVVDNVGDVVTEQLNAGLDTVQSSVSYTLSANVENLTLTGTGAITATGNSLTNLLTGNAGANVLDGGTGADTLAGGAGNDTYVVDDLGDVVTELLNQGTDTVQSAVSYTLGSDLENLTLTGTAALSGTGNSLNNVLTGNSAANVLAGGDGNDTLDGGAGADTLIGGLGNDTYLVDNGSDVVTEQLNEGTDTVQSSVTYTLAANVENLTLTGSALLNGTGNALANVLTGNSAANILTGGAGNDTYVVSTGDTVVEQVNEGTDTVQSDVSWTLGANLENLTLTGTAAIAGSGNTLANTLRGNSAANVLTGGAGNDTYVVSTGDTVVEQVNEGTDTVQSDVSWTLGANLENLTLTGAAAINAAGNGLANVLTGNGAANQLAGGTGNDTLRGGLGNDTYLVNRGEGQDLIAENDATVGNADTLLYGATINPLDLVLSRQANDLRLAIHGSTDFVTIQDWYTSPTTNQIETVQAGNGQLLLSTQVDQLIQAMAGFTSQSGLTWDQAIDQRPQDVQAVLAASWQ